MIKIHNYRNIGIYRDKSLCLGNYVFNIVSKLKEWRRFPLEQIVFDASNEIFKLQENKDDHELKTITAIINNTGNNEDKSSTSSTTQVSNHKTSTCSSNSECTSITVGLDNIHNDSYNYPLFKKVSVIIAGELSHPIAFDNIMEVIIAKCKTDDSIRSCYKNDTNNNQTKDSNIVDSSSVESLEIDSQLYRHKESVHILQRLNNIRFTHLKEFSFVNQFATFTQHCDCDDDALVDLLKLIHQVLTSIHNCNLNNANSNDGNDFIHRFKLNVQCAALLKQKNLSRIDQTKAEIICKILSDWFHYYNNINVCIHLIQELSMYNGENKARCIVRGWAIQFEQQFIEQGIKKSDMTRTPFAHNFVFNKEQVKLHPNQIDGTRSRNESHIYLTAFQGQLTRDNCDVCGIKIHFHS